MTKAPILAAAGLLLLLSAPAQAQTVCPEGRTFSGACVKPGLAQDMRQAAIVYSIPKFSFIAPPVLPSEDGKYFIPRDYNSERKLFGAGNAGCVPFGIIVLTC